jgi:serine protease AprX
MQALIALALCLSLLVPATLETEATRGRVGLLMDESSDQTVRIMVGKADHTDRAEKLVEGLGGRVLKALPIINAFAAELRSQAAARLANETDAVSWVALDSPMTPAATAYETVRDEFAATSYKNNDGSAVWLAPWDENDYGEDSPSKGYIFVSNGRLAFHYVFVGRSISRSVDLSGAGKATLSFDYEMVGLDEGESISVLVSDGDGSDTVLDTFTGSQKGTAAYDISAFLSRRTTIRFENLSTNWDYREYAYFDNVQVEYALTTFDQVNTYLATTSVDQLQGLDGQGMSVVVVDSGTDAHSDLTGRVSRVAGFAGDDLYGHGTHVAGIIAGDGAASSGAYAGVAPGVHVIGLRVSDEIGMAYESDVVDALQWVHDNKDQYNIRVVNMSLNSTVEASYHESPLNAAAEILWFNGVVVVVSAGNKGPAGGHNTARTAPANDPFLIAVGASHEHGTANRADDTIAAFSSFGVTLDGFVKPDLIAPGFDLIAPLSSFSDWNLEHPDKVVGGEYIRLSGTSMAAPVVTGAVALLLQDEPGLNPDQVKYRLLHTGGKLIDDDGRSWKYIDIAAAVHGTTTESANLGLKASQLLWTGDEPITWGSVNWNSVNWNSVNWNSVNWNSVKLDGIFWGPGKGKGK